MLPLKYDIEEAHFSHDLLLEIVLENTESIIQNNDSNYDKIIKICGEILDTKLCNN